MIAVYIKAKVCVICRSRRLTQITQTEALVIIAIMRKPNPIIVLLGKRTDSSISLDERQIKECFSGWLSLLFSSLLVCVLGDVTSTCIKLLSVGKTSILHI